MSKTDPDSVTVLGAFDQVVSLENLLSLTSLGQDSFANTAALLNVAGYAFGGQLAAHSLLAASRTVPGLTPVSAQFTFVTSGLPARPYAFEVRRLRDGSALTHRAVSGRQDDRSIVEGMVIFQSGRRPTEVCPVGRGGWAKPPTIAHPDSLSGRKAQRRATHDLSRLDDAMLGVYDFLDIRQPPGPRSGTETVYWLRVPSSADLGEAQQFALLTLLTDFWFGLPMFAHRSDRTALAALRFASLDHAIWFHAVPRCDAWLLFHTEMVLGVGDSSLCRAQIFDETGAPVATIIQQGICLR